MLTENKFSKYLIYAIGEIILVVIGILIALQVNNWNEQRKLDAQEIIYLNRLKKELESDVAYFEIQIQEGNEVISSALQFINQMYQTQNSEEEVTALTNKFNPRTERLILQNSTYEEMKSSGKLGIITDDSLRNQINDFYRTSQHSIRIMDDYNDLTIDILGHLDFNMFKLNDIWKNAVYKDKILTHLSDWEFFNDPTSNKFKQVENLIFQYIGKHIQEKTLCTQIISNQKLLIENINQEINKST
jgi:hypothetical protein